MMDYETYSKKYKFFLTKYFEKNPIGTKFISQFYGKMEESWKDIGTFLGDSEEGRFHFDSEGHLRGSASFWMIIGCLSEIILNSFAKHTMSSQEFKDFQKEILLETKKTAKKTAETVAIKSINIQADMSSIECDMCGHLNPAGSKFCNECGNSL